MSKVYQYVRNCFATAFNRNLFRAAEMLKYPFPQAVPRCLPTQKSCDCHCKHKHKRQSKFVTREEFATMAEYACKREAAVNSAQELVGFFNVMLLVADVIRERKTLKREERRKAEEGSASPKEKPKKDNETKKPEDKKIPEKEKPSDRRNIPERTPSVLSKASTVVPPQDEVSIPDPEADPELPNLQEQVPLDPPTDEVPTADKVPPQEEISIPDPMGNEQEQVPLEPPVMEVPPVDELPPEQQEQQFKYFPLKQSQYYYIGMKRK